VIDLQWHKGIHQSGEHDGYPRHAHSLNGALTIVSDDPSPHFSGGAPFTTPKARAEPTVYHENDDYPRDIDEKAMRWAGLKSAGLPERRPRSEDESEQVWRLAQAIVTTTVAYRVSLSPAERAELDDACQVLLRLGGRIKRGEVT
jgi:hypothetical protein